jgi:regulator of sirC expression with transglutaminase-like and TPR domain
VQERLIILLPQSWAEVRDRGLVHAELGNPVQALDDLECYLLHADGVVDVDAIAERVDALRSQRG